MRSQIAFSIFLIASMSSVALADTPTTNPYTIRVEVPSLQSECAAQANVLANRFRSALSSSVSLVWGECTGTRTLTDQGKRYSVDTIVIHYFAQSQVTPIRAIFSGSDIFGTPDESLGLFRSYAECLAQQPKQVSFFTWATGLNIFDMHCDLAPDPVNHRYSLVVEGLGTPKNSLFAYSLSPVLSGAQRSSGLIEAAQNAIIGDGGKIAYATDTRVFYYAPYAIPVMDKDLGSFTDPSQCTQQVPETQKIMTAEGFPNSTVFCSRVFPNSASDVELTAIASGVDVMQTDVSSDQYATFQECMMDQDRVLSNAASNGEQVVGAICRHDDGLWGGFVLEMYLPPR